MKTPSRKPTRILMTADTVGGVWNYAIELVRALADHGVQVALATMGGHLSRDQRRVIRDLRNTEVFESSFKLEWMDDPWTDVARAGNWLLEIEQRTAPDLIHLNNFAHGAVPFRVPKIVVGHSCVASWWKAVKGTEIPASWAQYIEVVRAGLQSAHLVLAPSQHMLQLLNHYYGPLAGKVIYNGRDPARFMPGRKEEIILAAGRVWDDAKNIKLLTDIAPDLPWPVYVAGEQKRPNGTTAFEKKVQCLGRLPEDMLSKWYSKSAIYAFPARYEPFGLSVLEAGLAGCALVLGNIPSLRELWGGVALFVSPDDPLELKFTLQRLIQNLFRRKEMAAYAQCRAIQLTSKRMAAEYLAVYSEVLTDFSPPQLSARNDEKVLCVS